MIDQIKKTKVRAAIRANRSDDRASRNSVWKGWTKERGRLLTNRTNKKQHRTVEITDPDFCSTGVEIEGAFLVDLGGGIRGRKDFDTNRRRSAQGGCWIRDEPAFLWLAEQDHIGDPHLAVASKNGLLDRGEFAGVKLIQEIGDSASSLAMVETRGRRHDDLARGIDLEAFGSIGEGRIAADFEPPFGGWRFG
jgi:hypothetical protein